VGNRRQGVEGEPVRARSDRLFVATQDGEQLAAPHVGRGVVGVDVEGPGVRLLGGVPIPLPVLGDLAESRVCLGQVGAELESASGSGLPLAHRLGHGEVPIIGQDRIGQGHPGVRTRVTRIQHGSLAEPLQRRTERTIPAAVPVAQPDQIEVVSARIVGRGGPGHLRTGIQA